MVLYLGRMCHPVRVKRGILIPFLAAEPSSITGPLFSLSVPVERSC